MDKNKYNQFQDERLFLCNLHFMIMCEGEKKKKGAEFHLFKKHNKVPSKFKKKKEEIL